MVLSTFIVSLLIDIIAVPLIVISMEGNHRLSWDTSHSKSKLIFSHNDSHDSENKLHEHDKILSFIDVENLVITKKDNIHDTEFYYNNSEKTIISEYQFESNHIIEISSLENEVIKTGISTLNISERGPPVLNEIAITFNYILPKIKFFYTNAPPLVGNILLLSLKTIVLTI